MTNRVKKNMETERTKRKSRLKTILLISCFAFSFLIFSALIFAASPYRSLRPYRLFGVSMTKDQNETVLIHGINDLSDYYIDRIPVTIGNYKLCAKENKCAVPHYRDGFEKMWTNPFYEFFPVTFVAWQAARDYCIARGGDLPTSQQWSHAASFGNEGRYAWGNDLPSLERTNADGFYQWLTPAGWLPQGASATGLLDMNGNVREWILNENPDGTGGRGLKGGGSQDSFSDIATENTFYHYAISAGFNRGFRCVYPVSDPAE